MIRKKIMFIIIIPALAFGLWDADTHNINNWVFSMSNYSRFGFYTGVWLPESTLFVGAGLCFGSISPLSETLVTVGYDYSGQSEYGPGLRNQDHNSPVVRIYMFPDNWPADPDTFPMAPQIALTQQESWSCYNDFDSTLHQIYDGGPIGIEVYQTTFADTLSAITDVIFLKYEVKNCTTYTINDAIVTVVWNQSLPWNGFILNKWFYTSPSDSFFVEDLGYCYDDSVAIGILFIKTPDDLGCSAYKTYIGSIAPNKDRERYMVMAGYNYQSGVYDPYDSLAGAVGWAYMSSGKFSLLPNEIKEFTIAVIAAYYINDDTLPLAITANNAKNFYLDSLLAIYETNKSYDLQLNAVRLCAYPNPFSKQTKICFGIAHPDRITHSSYGTGNAEGIGLKIYDASGRLVRKWDYSIIRQSDHVIWNADDENGRALSNGIYFVVLENGKGRLTQKLILMR